MPQTDNFAGLPQSDFEAWRDLLRTMGGRYYSEGTEPDAFTGWIRPVSVCGFSALNIGCNARRIERTHRDARRDNIDHYCTVFQIAGQSEITHNDQALQLAAGDVAFIDAALPMAYFANNGGEAWNTLTLSLPRQSLVSHLGFAPQGGLCRRGGTSPARLLFDLIRNAAQTEKPACSPADRYMQLAVYDLVGALFAPSGPLFGSRHSDALFKRIHGIIRDGFADPNFGPNEVAAQMGISLRYLQKLFTERGSTCSELIFKLRLDYAACLVHRRSSLGTSQPLSEIAYACGFRDYTHFARKFRHRFGYAPGAYSEEFEVAGHASVRASADERASWPHDSQPLSV